MMPRKLLTLTKNWTVRNTFRCYSNHRLLQNIVHPGTNTMLPYSKYWPIKSDSIKMISSMPSSIQIDRGTILAINLNISNNFFCKSKLEIAHNGAKNLYEDNFQSRHRIIWNTLGNNANYYQFRFTERGIRDFNIVNEYKINVELLNEYVNSDTLIPESQDQDISLQIGM